MILNDDSTLNVSADTREKVVKIALEMGYKSVAQRHKNAETSGYACVIVEE